MGSSFDKSAPSPSPAAATLRRYFPTLWGRPQRELVLTIENGEGDHPKGGGGDGAG